MLAIGTGMERDKVLHHPGDLDYTVTESFPKLHA